MKISLKNFRCFADTSAEFPTNWNVVVGHGKSALLDAVLYCVCPRAYLPKGSYNSPLRVGEDSGQVVLETSYGEVRLDISRDGVVREGSSGVTFCHHVSTSRKDRFGDVGIHHWLDILEHKMQMQIGVADHPDTMFFEDVKRVLKDVCGVEVVHCSPRFRAKYRGVVHSFRDLPESIQNLTQWVGDLLRCWSKRPGFQRISNFNLHMEGLVLVDNFDQNLPPYVQQLLPGKLKTCFPKVKFIVTTNSMTSLLDASSEEVIHLRRSYNPDDSGIIVRRGGIPTHVDMNFLAYEYGGMPIAGSSARLSLMERYRLALRAGEPVAELEAELRRHVGPFADTSLERLAWGVAAQLMREEVASITPERRVALRQQVLERLREQREGK